MVIQVVLLQSIGYTDVMSGDDVCWCLCTQVVVPVFGVIKLVLMMLEMSLYDHQCMSTRVCINITCVWNRACR